MTSDEIVSDEIRIFVREPRRTARWLTIFLGLFVVLGVPVMAGALAGGDETWFFAVAWGLGFVGGPLFILWRLRGDLAEADFLLDPYGIHSAHEREELVAWEDVVSLDWVRTNVSVNEEPLRRLVARHADGRHTRVSSLGLRRSKGEIDEVNEQLSAGLRTLGLVGRVAVDGRAVAVDDGVWDDTDDSDDSDDSAV